MESDGNNHKRIFFNWLLCLSVLLSVIALYISLGFDKKIHSQFEQINQAQFAELAKLSEDFEAHEQRLQSLVEALVEQKRSIQAVEQKNDNMSTVVRSAKSSASVSSSLPSSNVSQQKVIPENVIRNTSVYTIQSGDTFSKIAVTYGVPLQALMEANRQLNPRSLKVGQEIIIPK